MGAVLIVGLLMCATAGCGGPDGSGESRGSAETSSPTFEPVTDQAAGSLTKAQVEEIIRKCEQYSGIPGANDNCENSIPQHLPPCGPRSLWCIRGGILGRRIPASAS